MIDLLHAFRGDPFLIFLVYFAFFWFLLNAIKHFVLGYLERKEKRNAEL